MVQLNFDSSTVDPGNVSYECIPPGWYDAHIVQSQMKPTSNGNGQMLELEFDIISGPMSGRKVWDRLNLVNPSQEAMDIAQRTLSRICRSIGVVHVADSDDLHFKPMAIKVKISEGRVNKKTGETYDPSNEIKGYKPLENGAAAPSQQAATATTPAPAVQHAAPPPTQDAKPVMPWDKPKAS